MDKVDYGLLIQEYECDCPVLSGTFSRFSDYIKDASKGQHGDVLDIGAGPKGGYCNYFTGVNSIDGCDADQAVVDSLPSNVYRQRFVYLLGGPDPLPYSVESKDLIICSCVIHHLGSSEELSGALSEISRVLRWGGTFFLMFKAGAHDTLLTHFSHFYDIERSIRVFDPDKVIEMAAKYGLRLGVQKDSVMSAKEILVDPNWLVNCCLVFTK